MESWKFSSVRSAHSAFAATRSSSSTSPWTIRSFSALRGARTLVPAKARTDLSSGKAITRPTATSFINHSAGSVLPSHPRRSRRLVVGGLGEASWVRRSRAIEPCRARHTLVDRPGTTPSRLVGRSRLCRCQSRRSRHSTGRGRGSLFRYASGPCPSLRILQTYASDVIVPSKRPPKGFSMVIEDSTHGPSTGAA
jgi:hypothetical protein